MVSGHFYFEQNEFKFQFCMKGDGGRRVLAGMTEGQQTDQQRLCGDTKSQICRSVDLLSVVVGKSATLFLAKKMSKSQVADLDFAGTLLSVCLSVCPSISKVPLQCITDANKRRMQKRNETGYRTGFVLIPTSN